MSIASGRSKFAALLKSSPQCFGFLDLLVDPDGIGDSDRLAESDLVADADLVAERSRSDDVPDERPRPDNVSRPIEIEGGLDDILGSSDNSVESFEL